ncbi:MAG: hypothetical protein K0Q79_734 [Flavipsychrobacter sp.]|nr:hypothetical protein [Flavipsychrobacter sp.]
MLIFGVEAQNKYSISGKLVLPNKEDEYEFSPRTIWLKDSIGNTIGGTADSALFFNFQGLGNGKYILALDTEQSFFVTKPFDTVLVVNNNSIRNIELKLETVCTVFTEDTANNDIAKGHIRLIMEPGSVMFKYSKKQKRIQKKYKLEYYWSGCYRFTHYSCLKSYNRVIFSYLDNKYGAKWRTKVIDKVVGLN